MSDFIRQYPELVTTWDVYPRVHYFRGRFLDLVKRLKRITGALPKALHDRKTTLQIEEMKQKLEKKNISITVFGKEHLSCKELYVGQSEEVNINSDPPPPCLTLAICYATIDAFDDGGFQQIMTVILYASRSTFLQSSASVDLLLVVCKAKASFSETESMGFRKDLHKLVQTTIPDFRIKFQNILVSSTNGLNDCISAMYERRIINAFSSINSYLNHFMKGNSQCVHSRMNVTADVSVHQRLKDYLRNGFSMSDINKTTYRTQLLDRLARCVKCTIISPLSAKYVLPHWLCNCLLHEIQFEEVMVKSVSKKTSNYLRKLERIHTSCKISNKEANNEKMFPYSKLQKCPSRHVIAYSIQKDLEDPTAKAEKVLSSMMSLTIIMRKMTYEIKGYLKQTIIHDVLTLQPSSRLDIPQSLRRDILSIQGVYGVGTIYDQLEVHVDENNETRISEMMARLRILTKKHQFFESYTVKCIRQ